MSKSETILNELAFPIRTKILEELLNNPLKLNDISQKFTVSKSEISRHLSRLIEINIVTKDSINHSYILTPLGEAYISLSEPVKFILDQNEFFENHFIDLPSNLYRMIDNLYQAELILGSGDVLTSIQTILENTESNVQILLDQKFPLSLKKQIKTGNYIVSKDIIEKGMDYAKKVYEQVNARIYNAINHNMVISDRKIGMICFPGLNHKADINYCFKVSDKIGLDYLQNIWDYYSEISDPFHF